MSELSQDVVFKPQCGVSVFILRAGAPCLEEEISTSFEVLEHSNTEQCCQVHKFFSALICM